MSECAITVFQTVSRFRYHFDAKICSAAAGCEKCKKVFENKSKLERHLDEVHKVKDAYKSVLYDNPRGIIIFHVNMTFKIVLRNLDVFLLLFFESW